MSNVVAFLYCLSTGMVTIVVVYRLLVIRVHAFDTLMLDIDRSVLTVDSGQWTLVRGQWAVAQYPLPAVFVSLSTLKRAAELRWEVYVGIVKFYSSTTPQMRRTIRYGELRRAPLRRLNNQPHEPCLALVVISRNPES